MEEKPESPPEDDIGPAETAPYTGSHKVIAVCGIVGCVVLAYLFMDVLADGRLTRALSAVPMEDET